MSGRRALVQIREPDEFELGLFMGLWIGEGSFSFYRTGHSRMQIQLEVEDEHFLRYVQEFAGGNLMGPYARNYRADGFVRKPCVILNFSRRDQLDRLTKFCLDRMPVSRKRRQLVEWSERRAK